MSINVETEIELLKREVSDMKGIHVRLDTAIEKRCFFFIAHNHNSA